MLPLFEGDVALQDLSVASLVEFALHKDQGLGTMCEPLGLHLVGREHLMEEVIEVKHPLVSNRIGLCH